MGDRLGDLRSELPAHPCRTFVAAWDVPDLVRRFVVAGRPGAYLRISQAGLVGPGDGIAIEHRPGTA